MAPRFKVYGIVGATDVDEDDWMFSNFCLYHELSRHLEGEWIGCVPLQGNRAYFNLHGDPNAERIVVRPDTDQYGWYKAYPETDLKRKAVRMVHSRCRVAKKGDRIIIFLVGHGHGSGPDKGAVYLGSSFLRPEDFFESQVVQRCKADITLIVDSCFSGVWVTKSEGVAFRSNFEIISRADDDEETLSWAQSGSHRRRGGIFANFIASSVYGEYDLYFPRPLVPNGEGQLEQQFPASNLPTIQPDGPPSIRQYYSRLKTMVLEMCAAIARLSPVYPLPKHGTRGRRSEPVDGLAALGMAEGVGFRPRLHRLVSPNPPIQGEVAHNTGHMGLKKHLDKLIIKYVSGPHFPDQYASETVVFSAINHYHRDGIHNPTLQHTLELRVTALLRAQKFAADHGISLPTHWKKLDAAEMAVFKDNRGILEKFAVVEPTITTWTLPMHLLAAAFYAAGKSPLVVKTVRGRLRQG